MAPQYSIVIPTLDRPAELERCIASIGAMTDASRVEVVVVNDGGDPPDELRLKSLAGAASINVRSQSRLGPSAARNNGAYHSQGEYIVFLDDDCLLPPDWMARLGRTLQQHPKAMIGGLTINILSANLFAETSQVLVDYVSSYYNDPAACRTPLFTSNNMIVPADMFRVFGGFDETFRAAEDRELCRRWKRKDLPMVRDRRVVVLHAHRLTLRSMLRQHFTYGRGALPYWQQESGSITGIKVEPLSFYVGMVSYPFRAKKKNAAALCVLIVVTQIANAAGFACEAAVRFRNARAARSAERHARRENHSQSAGA